MRKESRSGGRVTSIFKLLASVLNYLAAHDSSLLTLGAARRLMALGDPVDGEVLQEAKKTALKLKPRENTDLIASMPMRWLDQCTFGDLTVLSPAEDIRAVGPADVTRLQSHASIRLEPVVAYRLSNVKFHSLSTTAVLDKCALVERPLMGDPYRINMSAGHLVQHGSKRAFLRNYGSEKIKKGISLAGNAPWNYYHWMMEILPKLLYLDQLDPETADWPVLIPEDALKIPNMVAGIAALAPQRKIRPMMNDRTYIVDDAIVISSPSLVPYNLRNKYRSRPEDAGIRPSALRGLAAAISGGESESQTPSERLYLARGGTLRSFNEVELIAGLRDRGFRTVYPGEYSLHDQAELFASAQFLLGASGAAWTGLMFAQSGAKALSWLPFEIGDFSLYSTMASVQGVDLRFIKYKTSVDRTDDLYRAKYTLNVNEVISAVDLMMNRDAR